MRRSFTTLAVVALLIGLLAAPASADDPDVFTDTWSFDDFNPCTGEAHTVTIRALISVHEHDGTFFVRLARSGFTSDGFYMGSGSERYIGSEDNFATSFNDPWVNPDLGTRFAAQGRLVVVDGEAVVDDFRLACKS